MVLPTTPEQWDAAAKAIRQHAVDQERLLRDLLGQWVSEHEPEVVYGYDFIAGIKGLAIRGDLSGRIVVKNPHWRPGAFDFLFECRAHSGGGMAKW